MTRRVPTREQIVTLDDPPAPPGASPWVAGAGPSLEIRVVDPDPDWPRRYAGLAGRVRDALGWRVLAIDHVGSTAVPGLAAKPVIDIDLVVADPDDEAAYVPALVAARFEHRVREPWLFGHRMLRSLDPVAHLHVHGPDSPEPWRHRLFRDWLRGDATERARYAEAKLRAAEESRSAGEHGMQYNARKEAAVHETYRRAFAAAGLLPG